MVVVSPESIHSPVEVEGAVASPELCPALPRGHPLLTQGPKERGMDNPCRQSLLGRLEGQSHHQPKSKSWAEKQTT